MSIIPRWYLTKETFDDTLEWDATNIFVFSLSVAIFVGSCELFLKLQRLFCETKVFCRYLFSYFWVFHSSVELKPQYIFLGTEHLYISHYNRFHYFLNIKLNPSPDFVVRHMMNKAATWERGVTLEQLESEHNSCWMFEPTGFDS